MKLILKLLSVFFIWGSLTLPAFALDPVYSDFLGKAIRGYDPVAYFTQSNQSKVIVILLTVGMMPNGTFHRLKIGMHS